MPVLYVTPPGAVVRKAGGSLLVTRDEDPDGRGPLAEKRTAIAEVEPHRLEMVVLLGHSHITTDALHLCLDQGIGVAYFRRNGDFLGRLVPEAPRMGDLRLLQYAAVTDPQACLAHARAFVAAKLRNAAQVLADVQSNQPSGETLTAAIASLRHTADQTASSLEPEELLGHEGSATRVYFDAFATAFRAEIAFARRQRRPPPDPANALLSFGYVLLANLLAGLLEARGLDPALGFYHRVRPGRPSLALDLLEELRHPLVDRFVLRACNLRIFRAEMFEPDRRNPGGVMLTRPGLRVFFRQWEAHLRRPVRERGLAPSERLDANAILRRQVERLASDLRGGPTYQPLHYGG